MAPINLSVTTSAPAKIILFGEHSVVYGYPAIAASINRRTTVTLKLTDSKTFHVYFRNLKADFSFRQPVPLEVPETKTLKPSQKQAIACVFSVYNLFRANLENYGLYLEVSSDFPCGAGLGSSASFSVALAAAFYAVDSLLKSVGPNITSGIYPIFEEFRTKVREISHDCEKIFHGNPSGIDSYVCSEGGIIRFVKEKGATKIAHNMPMKIGIVNSEVERNTAKLVGEVRTLKEELGLPVNKILETMADIVESVTKQLQGSFVKKTFLELVRINHGLLCALGVSHPKLEAMNMAVSELDVAFKLTGAGGGGNGLVFIPRRVREDDVKLVMQEAGFNVDVVEVGVPGLKVFVDYFRNS